MAIVGRSVRCAALQSCLLQLRLPLLSAQSFCSAANNRSPVHTWTLSPPAGRPSVCCWSFIHNQSGSKNLLGLWTLSDVRRFSGSAGATGSSDDGVARPVGAVSDGGWYGVLSESAPVHLCEDMLVSLQQASGLPWWTSIFVTTLSVRTLITLPLAAYQMVIISKVEALQVEIAELAKRLRYEVSVRAKERGWTEKQSRIQFKRNLSRLISGLYIRDNCHPFKASLLVWVQIPLWISLSLALRNLSLHPIGPGSGLSAGGTLWFPDLTIADSTWILPVCLGLTNLLIVELFSLQRVKSTPLSKIVTNFIRAFSILMIPIAATVPSSMALYWFVSSLIGFSHNLVLRSPSIHKILKLKTPRSDTPYRDLLTAFINKYSRS